MKKIELFFFEQKHKLLTVVLLVTLGSNLSFAQSETSYGSVIQFSGIIINQESLEPIIGVHIFSPKFGKGATTDYYGKFSFPIKEGDSLIITAVGFEKRTYTVPKATGGEDKFTTLLELTPSTTYLEEVKVTPYPTELLFKDAILALNDVSSRDQRNLKKTTEFINSMKLYKGLPRSSTATFNEALAIREQELRDEYSPRVFAPINPIAWVKLIRSLKKK